jgi:tRNA G18 (ribose-2'-O)-methylase SpoU
VLPRPRRSSHLLGDTKQDKLVTMPSQWSAFVLGVATTVTVGVSLAYLPRITTSRKPRRFPSDKNGSDESNSRSVQSTDLLDSPGLDMRLLRKAEAVIQQRSGNLTVVVERCTNDHNYSAILRTAEALGIQNVWIIDPAAINKTDEGVVAIGDEAEKSVLDKKKKVLRLSAEEVEQRGQHRLFAKNATEWLSIRNFETTDKCVAALRETGHQIWVTDLSQKAVELTPDSLERHGRWPLPNKTAIVFGTEAVGCSEEMLQAADLRVYLPLRGFADSLNLSVATALVIHHLLLMEPSYAASMTEDERKELRRIWYPKLARQRLLTSKDKKRRRKILYEITKCEDAKVKRDAGAPVSEGQLDKIEKLEIYQTELAELEARAHFNEASEVVEDLIENPPEPLSDLRRADLHRVTFAGRNVKRSNADYWKGLSAVEGLQTVTLQTAGFFRQRLAGIVGKDDKGSSSSDPPGQISEAD